MEFLREIKVELKGLKSLTVSMVPATFYQRRSLTIPLKHTRIKNLIRRSFLSGRWGRGEKNIIPIIGHKRMALNVPTYNLIRGGIVISS